MKNSGIEVISTPDSFEAMGTSIASIENEAGMWIAQKLELLLKQRLSASGIKSRTGALYSSVSVQWIPGTQMIQIGVKKYGYFLSWGVGPKAKKGKILDIAQWALNSLPSKPKGGTRFSYNPTYRKWGIPARKWLPDDNALQALVDEFVTEKNLA